MRDGLLARVLVLVTERDARLEPRPRVAAESGESSRREHFPRYSKRRAVRIRPGPSGPPTSVLRLAQEPSGARRALDAPPPAKPVSRSSSSFQRTEGGPPSTMGSVRRGASGTPLAIRNAKLYPSPDAPPIDRGTVLIRDGRIVAMGVGVSVPPDAGSSRGRGGSSPRASGTHTCTSPRQSGGPPRGSLRQSSKRSFATCSRAEGSPPSWMPAPTPGPRSLYVGESGPVSC